MIDNILSRIFKSIPTKNTAFSIFAILELFAINLSLIEPAKADIWDTIQTIPVPGTGRCQLAGEATISVRFLLRRSERVYVEVDKGGKLKGVVGSELNANNTSFRTGICNRDGYTVRVYTPMECGKTLLANSRFSRVYNEETVWIKEDGIELQPGDILNAFSESGRTALSLLATYYSGGKMAPVALEEASKFAPCLTGNRGCPAAPDLAQKIRTDRCLSSVVSQAVTPPPKPSTPPVITPPSPTPTPPPPTTCLTSFSPTAFQGRTGKVAFYNEWNIPVIVILYHPNSSSVYNRYTVPPGQNQFLGNNIIVGDDWGVCFENKPGASGFVNNLGNISIYNPDFQGSSLFMIQNGQIK